MLAISLLLANKFHYTGVKPGPTSLRRTIMGSCTCGYSTDPEKECNGTHKVVKAVKADIAEKLEANGFPHASEFVKNN